MLVKQSLEDPEEQIVKLAFEIVGDVPDKDYGGEAQAIYEWVRDNVRYTRDSAGLERVQPPVTTAKGGHGDCDDHSSLVAALLASIGHETRFTVVQAQEGSSGYDHVFAEVKIGDKWIAMDTTNKKNGYFGWRPPTIYKEAHMLVTKAD